MKSVYKVFRKTTENVCFDVIERLMNVSAVFLKVDKKDMMQLFQAQSNSERYHVLPYNVRYQD